MPELPEVEVVRRGLDPYVRGQRIREVEVFEPRSLRRHPPGAAHFRDALRGATILGVARRGKFMWLPRADAGEAIVIHLGMSGQLRVRAVHGEELDAVGGEVDPRLHEGPASDPARHLRIRLELESGTRIDFVDQRIFGGMQLSALVATADGAPAWDGAGFFGIPQAITHIARDLLDPYLDQKAVVQRIRSRSAPIKNLLLAQDLVSGIGNIYADEALWEARVHYRRPGSSLSAKKVTHLLNAASEVMLRALAVGGTSFDDLYVNVDGRSGYFARSLHVYGKAGEPCPRCGTCLKREVLAGRGTHFCPVCQRVR